jgi:anti-sigma B factor antagonist
MTTLAPTAAPFYVKVDHSGPVTILRTVGDLTGDAKARLRSTIATAVQRGRVLLVVDLGALAAADSASLSVVVGMRSAARMAGGQLVLAAAPDRVSSFLQIIGVTTVVPTFATVALAVASLKSGATS